MALSPVSSGQQCLFEVRPVIAQCKRPKKVTGDDIFCIFFVVFCEIISFIAWPHRLAQYMYNNTH